MNPISIPAPVGTANAGSARARTATPLALGVALATTYIAFAPKTGDLAAQSFRAGIVARTGFSSWNNFWYGGHHLPGYSVLFPAFGATLTPTVVGAIASLVAVWVFSRIVRTRATRPALATTAFALGVAANLVSGRLTF